MDGKAPADAVESGPALGWAVRASDDGTVRLATGGALEKLPGRVSFCVGTATAEGRTVYEEGTPPKWGVLRYHEADNNPGPFLLLPETYALTIYVSRSIYDVLQSLVAARTLPTITVTVGSHWNASFHSGEPEPADKDAVRYGWEPDGSGLEWDNKGFSTLEIKWCEFRVNVGLPKSKEDETQPDQTMMPPTRGDLANVVDSFALSVRRIERIGRALAVPLWIAVILLGLLVFR